MNGSHQLTPYRMQSALKLILITLAPKSTLLVTADACAINVCSSASLMKTGLTARQPTPAAPYVLLSWAPAALNTSVPCHGQSIPPHVPAFGPPPIPAPQLSIPIESIWHPGITPNFIP